tara:strand:+ start:55 stop:471 length:417 start_codon:yes stop_codon:yes gene_type:complete
MAKKKDGKKEMTASRKKIKDAREEKRTTRTVKNARKKLGKGDAQTGTVVYKDNQKVSEAKRKSLATGAKMLNSSIKASKKAGDAEKKAAANKKRKAGNKATRTENAANRQANRSSRKKVTPDNAASSNPSKSNYDRMM